MKRTPIGQAIASKEKMKINKFNNMEKKREIAEAMSEVIGHMAEALGIAYGCFIKIESSIDIEFKKR